MIRLFGLYGATGQHIAPPWLIEEQSLVWSAEKKAEAELYRREQEKARR